LINVNRDYYSMGYYSYLQIINYLEAKWRSIQCECKYEPTTICLFVTDRCTLSCKWCLRQSNPAIYSNQRQDMTLEQAKKILRYFPKATHLGFAGFGEPLVVDELFKINAELKKRPMKTSIITNGTLLLDRIDDVLQAKFHRISISINSLNAKDYKVLCGGNDNTFNNVMKGVQSLVQKRGTARLYIHFSFVLTRDLFKHTPEIIKFAEEMGVDCLDLHNLISHGDSNDYTGMLTMDDEEVVRQLSGWKSKKYAVNVGWPRLVSKNVGKPKRICKPLWSWLGIDMEGNTAGCHKVMNACAKYGNVFQEKKQVWNNEFRKILRKSFVNGERFLLDCCKTCTEVQ